MNLSELEGVAIDAIDAGVSLKVESGPGQGKSEFFKDLIRKLSERDGFAWGYAPTFLATMTPPDLMGYMFKGERPWGPGGSMVSVTDPTLPVWMLTDEGKPLHAYKRGLVVLEEYGQGEADVKRASAELFLNGKIGPWQVPNFGAGGWGVVALTNRFGKDRSGVTKDFDFVINRQMVIQLRPDVQGWERWAIARNMDPIIVSFAMQHPNIVWTEDVPKEQGPWCTPRSLVKTAQFLAQRAKRFGGIIPSDDPATIEAVQGEIGPGAASALFAHIKLQRDVPSLDRVVSDPEGTPTPTAADLRMLVVYSFSYKANKDNIGPLVTYISRLGKEFTMAFIRTTMMRDHTLINAPGVKDWAMQNRNLILQVSQGLK